MLENIFFLTVNVSLGLTCVEQVGDDKIEHCDHQITSDVDRFSEMFTEVLSQSLKPVVDFMVYSYELSRVQGLTTPLTLYAWYSFASAVSASTLPPFGELVATEQRLEGRFRSAHSTIIANCEQIAFLGGEVPERRVLDEQFRTLLNHCRHTINVSFGPEVSIIPVLCGLRVSLDLPPVVHLIMSVAKYLFWLRLRWSKTGMAARLCVADYRCVCLVCLRFHSRGSMSSHFCVHRLANSASGQLKRDVDRAYWDEDLLMS